MNATHALAWTSRIRPRFALGCLGVAWPLAALLVATSLVGCGQNGAGERGTLVDESGDGARACGSRGMAPCAEGEFCLFEVEAACGAADVPGRCEVIPRICTREYRPVCGCDGRTYSNVCDAHAGGASVAREGSCAEEPPAAHEGPEPGETGECARSGCGGEVCQDASDEPAMTTCVVQPEHACYRQTTCERQSDGRCAFTETAEFTACMQELGLR